MTDAHRRRISPHQTVLPSADDHTTSHHPDVLRNAHVLDVRRAGRRSPASGGVLVEHHFDHRSRFHEHVDRLLVPVPRRTQMIENGAAGCCIVDRCRPRGEIDVTATLQVDHEIRIGRQVCKPIPSARRTRDEESAVDVEHPDLDATRQTGLPSRGRDVHGRIISEFDAHEIHDASVGPAWLRTRTRAGEADGASPTRVGLTRIGEADGASPTRVGSISACARRRR